jgi:hypothetical protein
VKRHDDSVVVVAALEGDRFCSELDRASHRQVVTGDRCQRDRLCVLEQVLSSCCRLRGEQLSPSNLTSIDDGVELGPPSVNRL